MERSLTGSQEVNSTLSFNGNMKPILKSPIPTEKIFAFTVIPAQSDHKKSKVSFRKPVQNVVLVEPIIYESEKKIKSCACEIF
ncbi:unnamed protein product [Blepharisma stoltei]|uniref:Uncharacterized protein n=1 Tax=Blepharisma stoltei TaxID=1481888 RepID=A0AAU9I7X2_9CILI|nr:unnamed protein product [Blepharisma stoltei]